MGDSIISEINSISKYSEISDLDGDESINADDKLETSLNTSINAMPVLSQSESPARTKRNGSNGSSHNNNSIGSISRGIKNYTSNIIQPTATISTDDKNASVSSSNDNDDNSQSVGKPTQTQTQTQMPSPRRWSLSRKYKESSIENNRNTDSVDATVGGLGSMIDSTDRINPRPPTVDNTNTNANVNSNNDKVIPDTKAMSSIEVQ